MTYQKYTTPKLFSFKSALTLSLSFALVSCTAATTDEVEPNRNAAPPPASTTVPVDRAAADIGLLNEGGKQVLSFTTPNGYKAGDKLITYEGPGWESDKVGFRVYLDGRNALDIFGKTTSDMVLANVGRGDDYHAMADWGMDILKVGNSLGAGGFGVFENGEARQIGPAANYKADVVVDNDDMAMVRVTHKMSEACGDDVVATYTIKAEERATRVKLERDCALPYAAGIVIHEGTNLIESNGDIGWQYIGRWGDQSLVPDGLGMAIFYNAPDISAKGRDSDDNYVVFKETVQPDYYTATAWSQEPGGITSQAAFTAYLNAKQAELNAQ